MVSRVKRDFACTSTGFFPPVLVVLRAQLRLGLEGRARILSGPSPDLEFGSGFWYRPLCCGHAAELGFQCVSPHHFVALIDVCLNETPSTYPRRKPEASDDLLSGSQAVR